MQPLRSLLLSGTFLLALAVAPCVRAQDETPSPDQGAGATDLFPNGNAPTPAPAAPHGRAGSGLRRGGGNGGGRRAGRRRDMLVSQADSDPLSVRVAYRRAKTIALARDPGFALLLQQAADAPTDVQKRVYLKEYYTRLFASVRKVDPSPEMKSHVEILTLVAAQRYDPKRREVGGDEDLVNGAGRGRRGRVQ